MFYVLGLGTLLPWNFFITANNVSFLFHFKDWPSINDITTCCINAGELWQAAADLKALRAF